MRIFNRTGATVDIDDPSEFAKALLLYIQHALDHAEATQSSSSLTSAGENQAGGGGVSGCRRDDRRFGDEL